MSPRTGSITPDQAMAKAIHLSRQGFPAPNPRVGCVLVRDGEIVGEGFHAFAGGPHAEVVAIRNARDRAIGSHAFVTLEPCNHTGRTGPCTVALIAAGVAAVTFAVQDPNPVAAGGQERLQQAGVSTEAGFMEVRAAQANKVWLAAQSMGRPFVAAKAAISLDGRIALSNGASQWITGAEARRRGHRLRAEYGCVVVGRGTASADNPLLTARIPGVKNQPLRVVLDPHAKLPSSMQVFNSDAPTLRAVFRKEREGDVDVEPTLTGELNLKDLLQQLWSRGATSLLVEGGATTLTHFLRAELIDRLHLFTAPKVLGDGPSWAETLGLSEVPPARFRLSSVHRWGIDLETCYDSLTSLKT